MSDQKQATNTASVKPPVIKHNDGAVFAKVWENESDKGGVYFNVTSGKLYTDPKTGETRETQNLQKSDLPKMQYVLGEAYRSISMLQQSIKLEAKPEQEKQGWLSAPNGASKQPQDKQNGAAAQIENGRSQAPEM